MHTDASVSALSVKKGGARGTRDGNDKQLDDMSMLDDTDEKSSPRTQIMLRNSGAF